MSKTFSCVCFRVFSGAAFKRTWCIRATETRTVRSTKLPATAASTAGCRSALRSACPKKVSVSDITGCRCVAIEEKAKGVVSFPHLVHVCPGSGA